MIAATILHVTLWIAAFVAWIFIVLLLTHAVLDRRLSRFERILAAVGLFVLINFGGLCLLWGMK